MDLFHTLTDQAFQYFNPGCQKILEEGTDQEEGQKEDQAHNGDENRNPCIFSGQDLIELFAPDMFPALLGFDHAGVADLADEVKTHVRHGGTVVQAPLLLHLQDQVVQRFSLILIQIQPLHDQGVSFQEFAGGEADRESGTGTVIFDQMADRMDGPVDGAAVVIRAAEVLSGRGFLVFGDMDRVPYQFIHAFIPGGGNGDDRDAQHVFHVVDVDRTPVAPDFVHHVEGDHHGDIQLQQLHGQIQVPLNIGGVYNINDGPGMLLQDKITGYQFLFGIGGHGIDARQVGDQGVGMAPDDTVLAVYGNAREIAYMLIGSGQLVEQGRLAAVLVADQSEGQYCVCRQRISCSLGMEPSAFAKTGMFCFTRLFRRLLLNGGFLHRYDRDLCRVSHTQGQIIAMDQKLHGIAQRRQFNDRDLCPRDHAHVQEMLAERPFSADFRDPGRMSRL